MTVRLADLVLPDNTPVEKAEPTLPGMQGDMPPPKKRRWILRKPRPKAKAAVAKNSGSDWLIVAAGVALALTCALFPWYIFFNQEEFGIRPFRFDSTRLDGPVPEEVSLPELVGARIPRAGMPIIGLDPLPTGTVSDESQRGAAPLADQPFPGDQVDFQLVHVANGRAMIEDKDGFWMVQRGSRLPDGSRVAAIEEKDGRWVLVTSQDAVVPLVR